MQRVANTANEHRKVTGASLPSLTGSSVSPVTTCPLCPQLSGESSQRLWDQTERMLNDAHMFCNTAWHRITLRSTSLDSVPNHPRHLEVEDIQELKNLFRLTRTQTLHYIVLLFTQYKDEEETFIWFFCSALTDSKLTREIFLLLLSAFDFSLPSANRLLILFSFSDPKWSNFFPSIL